MYPAQESVPTIRVRLGDYRPGQGELRGYPAREARSSHREEITELIQSAL